MALRHQQAIRHLTPVVDGGNASAGVRFYDRRDNGARISLLGLALLWLAPVFHGTRLKRWTRWSLVANGIAIVPIVLTYFVDRAFIAITGPLWAIAIPASSLLLAVSFRRLKGASRVRSG